MRERRPRVLTGQHFMSGDHAIAEGALAAGCSFFAGYPITPSTEIAERLATRLPEVGGIYIQMEDELGSMAAILGAAWGGARAMTATSGPGFTLMMENIGLAAMTETPCVVVNVMRGAPSTGLPTLVGQGDVMQARFGSHGDYELVACCPSSCQEAFDLTVLAFNTADLYRIPVIILADEVVGHLTEKVVIPPPEQIPRVERKAPPSGPSPHLRLYEPDDDLIPPMPPVGEGYRVHVTGLTHDERGYPATQAEAHERLVKRLCEKIRRHARAIVRYEEVLTEDAEVVLVAYGCTARSAYRAIQLARERGIKVGLFRPITLWPFPEERMAQLAQKAEVVVAELNMGQMAREVERIIHKPLVRVNHPGGTILRPELILEGIMEAAS